MTFEVYRRARLRTALPDVEMLPEIVVQDGFMKEEFARLLATSMNANLGMNLYFVRRTKRDSL